MLFAITNGWVTCRHFFQCLVHLRINMQLTASQSVPQFFICILNFTWRNCFKSLLDGWRRISFFVLGWKMKSIIKPPSPLHAQERGQISLESDLLADFRLSESNARLNSSKNLEAELLRSMKEEKDDDSKHRLVRFWDENDKLGSFYGYFNEYCGSLTKVMSFYLCCRQPNMCACSF